MAGMIANSKFWVTLGGLSTLPVLYLSRLVPYDVAVGTTRSGLVWRVLALLFALMNLKSLPLAWHARLGRGLLAHLSFRRSRPPRAPGPAQLFQPIITSDRTSLLDMDYNLHKSNSTYFADLDVARVHAVACVFARGFYRARFGREGSGERLAERGSPDPKGRLGIMLGGVTCQFRRELKPYVRFEIWTRVLAWDRKWVYMVSHIVRAGAVRPAAYSLQPWRRGARGAAAKGEGKGKANGAANGAANGNANGHANGHANGAAAAAAAAGDPPVPHTAIVATSLAKYVFKRGRWTIPPEIALENSGLLPPRPEAGPLSESQRAELTDAHGELWDWERVELERERGMKVAQHMANLEELQLEFTGDGAEVLGRW